MSTKGGLGGGHRGRRRKPRYRRSSSTKSVPSGDEFEDGFPSLNDSFSGGYDFDFIEEPPEELNCSVCLLVLRDPHLTSCCGNHFCESCAEKIKEGTSPCPLCKDATFSTFLNKSVQRKVNELKIRCPRAELGCTWIGTIAGASSHMDPLSGDCEYVEVMCSLCNEEIPRKDLLNHMNKECAKRPFTCVHCGYSDTWIEVTTKHCKRCMNYPLQCPNMCGVGMIERKNLNAHIKDICPLQVEPCSFEFAGCSVQVARKDRSEHLSSNMANHVDLLAGVCAKYQTKLDTKEKEISQLQSTIKSFKDVMKSHETLILSLNQKLSQLQVSQQGAGQPATTASVPVYPPVDFYLLEFSYYKQANKKWASKPFYTHPGGYKMCLNVFANGIGKGKNSHVSVFVNLMKGSFDSDLAWPFQGEIVVSLRLESEDDIVKALVFGPKSPAKATQRVTEGEMNEFGQGEAQFVHYSKIASLSALQFIVYRVYWKPNIKEQ